MKNLLRLALLVLSISTLTLNSCKRNTEIAPSDVSPKDDVIFHKLMINGNETIIKEAEGRYYFSDDEILSTRQFNVLKRHANTKLGTIDRSTILTDFTKRWPLGVWYYKIQSNRTSDILEAMSWISSNSNIRFVERTDQNDYVTIYDTTNPSSSSSHIGMENGTKTIQISTSQPTGTIAHEIMHSLGFFHEQSRPDRDNYVTVHMDQMPEDLKYQYNIFPNSQGVGPFDFNSIMLYSSNSYMTKIDGTGWVYQRTYLSEGDKEGLGAMYGAKINGADQICTEGIYSISAGTLTLENATNIATLTNLGDNQYKLTKTGNGVVTLISTVLGNISTKRIVIGTPPPSITGVSVINTVGTYEYTIDRHYPNSTIEYIALSGDITINQIDDNHFNLQVNTPNESGMDFIIRIRAREVSSCGTSAYTTKNVTFKGF